MMRVLLTEPLDAIAEAKLAEACDVVWAADAREATLLSAIADCDALIARTHTPVTRAVLEAGRRLRVVGVAGVGLDRVDVEAATELGIRVVHTPGAASDAVAELTVGMVLLLLRPAPRLMREYAAGRFAEARSAPHGRELRDLTVGIVGMGRIGSRVGRICAAGFGARVIYNDIREIGPLDFVAFAVEKEELWRESDVVSLHVPLTKMTRRLVDAAALGRMKPDAYLLNTARGSVVDTAALVDALRSGRLGGAGLDVTDPEPLPPDHPLFALPSAIVTPHVAARTHGGLRRMCDVVDDVLAALRQEVRTH